ncbi:MAG: hypothetical protein GXP55_19335 [Deltaproteobacteria bacterium]|nr:hypothetical protein [Deltaproteobacteria bacterium]
MAYLHPYWQEQIARRLQKGGQITAICGPERSGLTQAVRTLVQAIARDDEDGTRREFINLGELRTKEEIAQELCQRLQLTTPITRPLTVQDTAELFATPSARPISLWCFHNFHACSDEVQSYLIQAIHHESLRHNSSNFSNFLLEGATDFDSLIARTTNASHPTLIAHTEPLTPWRMLTETEHLLSTLSSSRYPLSLVALLADITQGDSGFCNEFLLRLRSSSPTSEDITYAYAAIISHGATARKLRDIASNTEESLLTELRLGTTISAPAPPDCGPNWMRLYLAGIVEHDAQVCGFRLRSEMVARAIAPDGKPLLSDPRLTSARASFALWYTSAAELLLRRLAAKHSNLEESLTSLRIRSPWNGKRADVCRALANLLDSEDLSTSSVSRIVSAFRARISDILPDDLPASSALAHLISDAHPGNISNLLAALSFADLSNLSKSLGIITIDELSRIVQINSRRNEAAHFRPSSYHDLFELENTVPIVLPTINSRQTSDTTET